MYETTSEVIKDDLKFAKYLLKCSIAEVIETYKNIRDFGDNLGPLEGIIEEFEQTYLDYLE